MGGRDHFGRRRVTRPAALVCALGALVAALLLCGGPFGGHAGGALRTAAAAPHHSPAGYGPGRAAADRPVYECPDGMPGCSGRVHGTPAVLTVPPPAAEAPGVPVLAPRPRAAGRALPPQPPARAPDLHVLQVLRN
ncbi:hypothetical protein LG634_35195 [Streptomyces bambusae]|uniref:hypothetical protein n=1 Tax=Streptomyces bambusae TaxID=1550616 RepID=UPI001CFF831F|nr:hypothetical protein [Streptomyces bambusae]MCB5170037.1 hypothetical protein [Streptomyces bambusae]